jgi:hypothetical protein
MTRTIRLVLGTTALVAFSAMAQAQPMQPPAAPGAAAAQSQAPGPGGANPHDGKWMHDRDHDRGPMDPRKNVKAARPGEMKPGDMKPGDMHAMEMMRMMRMAQGGMMMQGMMNLRHVEGQLAFYKTELHITDAQAGPWDVFADALRAAAARSPAAGAGMMTAPVPAPEQMEQRIAMMSSRLDSMRPVVAALKGLYAVLSDEQKKMADEVFTEHMMTMDRRMP